MSGFATTETRASTQLVYGDSYFTQRYRRRTYFGPTRKMFPPMHDWPARTEEESSRVPLEISELSEGLAKLLKKAPPSSKLHDHDSLENWIVDARNVMALYGHAPDDPAGPNPYPTVPSTTSAVQDFNSVARPYFSAFPSSGDRYLSKLSHHAPGQPGMFPADSGPPTTLVPFSAEDEEFASFQRFVLKSELLGTGYKAFLDLKALIDSKKEEALETDPFVQNIIDRKVGKSLEIRLPAKRNNRQHETQDASSANQASCSPPSDGPNSLEQE